MRRRSESSGGQSNDFPLYPIGPILESYGGQPVVEGLGWKSYKCPWHGDRDASGSVNTQLQVYNCHAADCPKGNAVQVLMQWEGLNYREAVSRAEQITGQVGARTSPPDRRRGGSRGGRGGTRESARVWRRPGR